MPYELRSFKKPLIKGHTPIALNPPDRTIQVPVAVAKFYDESRGEIFEPHDQVVAGGVTPVDDAVAEATRLIADPDFWQLTIVEVAVQDGVVVARSTPHWCKDVADVETWLQEA